MCSILLKDQKGKERIGEYEKICHTNKDMGSILYNIVMKTPAGLRYGTITLWMIDHQVYGTLDLLEHSEPFSGTVDRDGNCTISGCLVTLMRTISYTAVGKVSPNAIELSLREERNIFEITGVAAPKSEVEA